MKQFYLQTLWSLKILLRIFGKAWRVSSDIGIRDCPPFEDFDVCLIELFDVPGSFAVVGLFLPRKIESIIFFSLSAQPCSSLRTRSGWSLINDWSGTSLNFQSENISLYLARVLSTFLIALRIWSGRGTAESLMVRRLLKWRRTNSLASTSIPWPCRSELFGTHNPWTNRACLQMTPKVSSSDSSGAKLFKAS